ncbi:hypothetical protein BDK51DRAFT_26745 [Blyttiomyces helicus]|uniref:Uncharacterized protein n=1 Tax=Blyttiomyces helicus TaxID=388810 RepID=A0A4P9VZD1_9FUNG|nr:hypothetical protein BDK51DRAFT_26745 [Blyttiomyces helicus]|eukprot:RKO85169.1 hypothetical protein BDK51DRAFT_26745 [Blyttiomyces helicus]
MSDAPHSSPAPSPRSASSRPPFHSHTRKLEDREGWGRGVGEGFGKRDRGAGEDPRGFQNRGTGKQAPRGRRKANGGLRSERRGCGLRRETTVGGREAGGRASSFFEAWNDHARPTNGRDLAGTRLALQLFFVEGFKLYSFQLQDSWSPVLLFIVTTSLYQDWVICAPAAFLGCGSRFAGSLSGIEP